MKKRIFSILFLAALATLWACKLKPSYEVGKVYHGFKLVKKEFVKEVNADCLYFIHEKSGAHLFKIAADDNNKLFNIAFKTVPENDFGTPHIMEHSVLNGSKNFPVKSPFDVLRKGSLNTFLNAMTGADITTYPVASMNNKDYFNLMHVYLDAVFNPLLKEDPRILKQEGWHYELDSINGELRYNGVVYNEMKGAYSSPTRELGYQINKILFPDNTYGVESGGYPTAIPGLTQEYFVAFHNKFYHPSNSYILLYGNADLDKELEFIDKEYLSKYDRLDEKIEIPLQKPFEAKKYAEKPYPVPEGSSLKDKTYLSMSYVIGESTDMELGLALDIITDALVNNETAPLRLALQEAGIGKDVNAWVNDYKQNVLTIRVQNANLEDKDRFDKIVTETLQKVVDEGFDKETIDGIVNRLEFRLREGNSSQKGLMYLWQNYKGWFFADDPYLGLKFEEPLAAVKDGIKNGLLQKIIKEQILNNPHALLLVLKPQPGLEKVITQKIKKELADYKASLSKEELEKLVEETKALKEFQKSEDSPEALAKMPMLKLSDISPDVEWYNLEEKKVDNVPVLYHPDFTNDILYTNLYFDLRVLPQELIPYAQLLNQVIGLLNTKNYSYGDLDNALNINTGGFYTSISSFQKDYSDDNLIPKFVVTSKAFTEKGDTLFKLISEILINTKYDDVDRLKSVLARQQSRIDARIKNNGMGVALTRLSSYYNKSGVFNEQIQGLEYYNFLTDLTTNFDSKHQEISEKLAETAKLLFNKSNLIAAVTCSDEQFETFENGLKILNSTLPNNEVKLQTWNLVPTIKNEGLMAASKVQFVTKGYDFKKLGYKWSGKMRVLSQILSTDYLQTQIRVIGGAYGGFCGFSQSGNVYFASYRDPNLKSTLENFDKTPEFLDSLEVSDDEMTRYIIGTVAKMEYPTTPSQRGSIAISRYFYNITPQMLKQEKEEVLSTTVEDIKSMKPIVNDILSQNAYCVFGNTQKIKENKDLFKSILNVTK
ncbi:insulinase family protein [Tenuifilum thalassicum]|uniref:Peptidase n=1 Tax=Tenuifilum thalassicum TaxID=2590900 RepID=A0A7D3XK58_9BACT|nr:insulinase family protein [Tenuifilum thalassicum]QKG79510.1 peptidase [Tenuifilum thalassicum]